MTFMFEYQEVVRKPNPMATINPLARGQGKTVNLEDRVIKLQDNYSWNKMIQEWWRAHKKFDLDRLPKVAMVKLGDIVIDVDVQRELDEKHCATKIINTAVFDEALLQTLQCIKNPQGQFISIDGQHTASSIAGLISEGLIPGADDWRQFEFPVQYIETDNMAFARRAFSILNGKGKKKQSAYQQLRNSVFIVRIDKDTSDEEDVSLERKVSIAEEHDCYPVEVNSKLGKYPGTFSNIATFKTLNEGELELACWWHNKYFHYTSLHVSTFFILRDIGRGFTSAKLDFSEKLFEELAALIQTLFVDLSQYQESVAEAYRLWSEKRYGYTVAWNDDAYSTALLQLYQKFGGEEKLPLAMLDRFDDLVKFFDEDVLSLAD